MATRDKSPALYRTAASATLLDGHESIADPAAFATACWLLRRYTSYDYIADTHRLLRGIVDTIDAWPQIPPASARGWTQALHERQTALERGLAMLQHGQSADAYVAVLDAVSGLAPNDLRDERYISLSLLLDQLGPAVAIDMERATAMALRIHRTLTAAWTYERVLADTPLRRPDPLSSLPLSGAEALELKTGEEVPQTGVWMPIAARYGCPNFLIAGNLAPLMTCASKRTDDRFTAEAATWRLICIDKRYCGDGVADGTGLFDATQARPAGLRPIRP